MNEGYSEVFLCLMISSSNLTKVFGTCLSKLVELDEFSKFIIGKIQMFDSLLFQILKVEVLLFTANVKLWSLFI